MKPIALVLLLAAMLAYAWPRMAGAAPAGVSANLPHARQAGEGDYRWFGLAIYHAQLWVGDAGYQGLDEHAAPFALDLRYARALRGRSIAAASIEQMQAMGMGTAPQHAAWRATMDATFPDVAAGSHLTGVFLTGGQVHFYHDDHPIGLIVDAQFARAFFAIWLDPATSAPALRAALLAQAGPRP